MLEREEVGREALGGRAGGAEGVKSTGPNACVTHTGWHGRLSCAADEGFTSLTVSGLLAAPQRREQIKDDELLEEASAYKDSSRGHSTGGRGVNLTTDRGLMVEKGVERPRGWEHSFWI